MSRILALSDEVDQSLGPDALAELRPDLVVSCGDLPADYLEYVMTLAAVPLLFVPGNHDPDLSPRPERVPLVRFDLDAGRRLVRFDLEERHLPGPQGGINVDGRVVEERGVIAAGLGGSVRYREGPNQFTQAEMRRRALALAARALLRHPRRRLDVLLTHAPPRGLGDQEDLPHQGFAALHRLVERLRPKLLVHGHVHPHGEIRPDRWIGETRVVNAVPHRLLQIEP